MNALDKKAAELTAQLLSYCRSSILSLGGLVERIKAEGVVTRETADAVVEYCEANSLSLAGLVTTLAIFSNEVADAEDNSTNWDVVAGGGGLEFSVKAESLEVAKMKAEARLISCGFAGAVIDTITEVVQANMSAEEISNYILANWSDYDRVPKCVNDAHLEATDNTIATFQESGQESTPGEFYAAYMRNLVFVLTCTEFGTAQACEWFKARGVKY